MNNYIDGVEVRRRLLLDKYYSGDTSSDEELELYALLLDSRVGDECYEDAILLRSQFETNYNSSSSSSLSIKNRQWLGHLSIAASITVVCLGLWTYHHTDDEPVWVMRNNITMTQEEVNEVVDDAVMHLIDALSIGSWTGEKAMGMLEKNLSRSTAK